VSSSNLDFKFCILPITQWKVKESGQKLTWRVLQNQFLSIDICYILPVILILSLWIEAALCAQVDRIYKKCIYNWGRHATGEENRKSPIFSDVKTETLDD
jgi:hypothetical protein